MAQGILISGRSRRRNWSADERRWILEEAFGGGAECVPAEVARRHDISTGQLYTWRKRALEAAGLSQAREPQFVPAIVTPGPSSELVTEPMSAVTPSVPAPAIEIELKKGVKVRIEAGVPAQVIAATLKALR